GYVERLGYNPPEELPNTLREFQVLHWYFYSINPNGMYYHRMGTIPPKRHTQFRQPDNTLYREEVVSSKGFSGIYSIQYHIHPPTRIKTVGESKKYRPKILQQYGLKHMHLNTSAVKPTGDDYLDARKVLLANADCSIPICAPQSRRMDYFYKNAEGDE